MLNNHTWIRGKEKSMDVNVTKHLNFTDIYFFLSFGIISKRISTIFWKTLLRYFHLFQFYIFVRLDVLYINQPNTHIHTPVTDWMLLLFRHQVVSNSLQPQGLQHTRLPCPSSFPGVCSNSCPSSQWCHPTITSSIDPFSSCPQSFPASGSFPMSRLFASGTQSISTSASASDLPVNIQCRNENPVLLY